MPHRLQIEEPELLLDASRVELPADLDQNFFPFAPLERSIEGSEIDLLCLGGNGVHFDLPELGIEPGLVNHFRQIEVGAGETVDHGKYIQDEFSRYAPGVGIGSFEDANIFQAIDAEQEKIVRPHRLRKLCEETHEGRRIEVADRAAEKNVKNRKAPVDIRKALFVPGEQTFELHAREICLDKIA